MSQRQSLRGEDLLAALEAGEVRVAEREPDGGGRWRVNTWVKEALLELFKTSELALHGSADGTLWPFVDKSPLGVQGFELERCIRLVPGGSSVRRGAYVADRVVLMPPCYVNLGAWIGADTMIDSHALVGSCAQIGERVHLSAGVQVGGVLEPIGNLPVVVEDDCMIGAQCGLFEGVVVRAGAVLAPGVTLTGSTPVYDLVHETVLRASADAPLEIPANAVVVPGARPVASAWGREQGLSAACALIVKLRDASTDAATALEQALR